MLFNSPEFIFAFLPLTLVGYFFLVVRHSDRSSLAWLAVTSLFFYGWWDPKYLLLFLASMLFNYATGVSMHRVGAPRVVLTVGVVANLLLLGYYKYSGFIVANVVDLLGLEVVLDTVVLPLGISFFTFQQIAYLVDTYKGGVVEHNFINYCLFIAFFPQLIAGPIVHHKEILPQFGMARVKTLDSSRLALGLTLFLLGMFKKMILADGEVVYVEEVFNAAEQGKTIGCLLAWNGVLAYTFQIYFDFSGYSDMALGLGWLFGIRLPINFNSPYKSTSIIEFWRRWHMTLSRFVRDYIYIPLGGNRKGAVRRQINLMTSMLLCGLWHGAGWTFVAWGGLHGLYLMINHLWQWLTGHWQPRGRVGAVVRWFYRLLTFTAVVVAWVLFRAADFSTTAALLSSMSNGSELLALLDLPWSQLHWRDNFLYLTPETPLLRPRLVLLLVIVWLLPNSLEFLHRYWFQPGDPAAAAAEGGWLRWQPNAVWAALFAVVASVCFLRLGQVRDFLYFQF